MCDNLLEKFPWITNEFFKNTLVEGGKNDIDSTEQFNENLVIDGFELVPAVGKGENFASDLLRAKVNYRQDANSCEFKSKSFIIKVGLSDDPDMEERLEDFDVFKREMIVYHDILPKMKKVMAKYGDDKIQLAAKCYGMNNSNPKYLMFEDLKEKNYAVLNQKRGLSVEENKLLLAKLAKFHAASAVVFLEHPELFKSHHCRAIEPENEFFIPLFVNSCIGVADACQNWEGYEKLSEKMRNFSKHIMEKGSRVYVHDENAFNVLNHGDLWINNAMYKKTEENGLEDTLFVDFQICYVGPPAIDLGYLFFTSSANDVDDRDFDQMIQYYHSELTAALMKYKYPKTIPTLTETQIDFLGKAMAGVAFTFITVAIRKLDDAAEAQLGHMLADTIEAREFRKYIFGTFEFRKRMQWLLEFFDRKGFLDGLN